MHLNKKMLNSAAAASGMVSDKWETRIYWQLHLEANIGVLWLASNQEQRWNLIGWILLLL